MFIFCLGIFLSGFVSTFGAILVSYGLLNGLGQTLYYPSATSLVGQLHKETRATALSLLQVALYVGIIGCSWLSRSLSEASLYGWRIPYKLFGGIGLCWAVVLLFFLKDTPHAQTVPTQGQAPMRVRDVLGALFSRPTTLLLALGFGMHVYVDVGFKTWMPAFLHSSNDFISGFATLKESFPNFTGAPALFAVVFHYLGALMGILVASRMSDRLSQKRPGVRLEMNALGLILAVPFIILMGQTSSLVLCCLWMTLFGVFRGVYDSNLFASLFDVIPARFHASAAGIMLCSGFIFGSSSATILGWMNEHLSMQTGISSLGAFYFLGGIFILLARFFTLKRDLARVASC